MRCSCAAAAHAGQTQQSGQSDLILFCFSERVDEEDAQTDVRRAARRRSREVDERGELEERRTVVRDAVTLISRWTKETRETAEACLSPGNRMCRLNLLWPQFSVARRVCYSVIFWFWFFKTHVFAFCSLHFNFNTPWNLTWLPHSALQRSKRVRRKRKKRKRKPRKRSLKARRGRRQRRRDKSRIKWKRKQKKSKRRHRKHSPEEEKAANVRQRGSHACSP